MPTIKDYEDLVNELITSDANIPSLALRLRDMANEDLSERDAHAATIANHEETISTLREQATQLFLRIPQSKGGEEGNSTEDTGTPEDELDTLIKEAFKIGTDEADS